MIGVYMIQNRKLLGILMGVLSAALYGTLPLLISVAADDPQSGVLMLGWRSFLITLFLIPGAVIQKADMHFSRLQIRDLLLCGAFCLIMTDLLLVLSYLYTNIGLATVCHFFYPVAVSMIMYFLFGEKFNHFTVTAALLTVTALVLLAYSSGIDSYRGMFIAWLSGIFWGCYIIALEKSSYKAVAERTVILVTRCISTIVFLGLAVLMGSFYIPGGHDLTAVLLGALVCVFGDLLTARAIRLAGSTTIAFVALTEPVVAILTDYMYYGTVPSFLQCIGYGLMLISIITVSIGKLQGQKG